MDADEKLIALKTAYADIILNISKEAALRIMSSEKRALLYQHELKVTKEEALRMLLRLKQMMDFRTSEVEEAALNQQKKIEELEAQLQEAEDIVEDLREKIIQVQADMERMTKDNVKNVNEHNDASSRDELAIGSDVAMPLIHQNECCMCCHSEKVCMGGSYNRNHYLPSIISRDKQFGLYRKGCTQRIRACEKKLLDKELCLSGETDILKDKNNSEEKDDQFLESSARNIPVSDKENSTCSGVNPSMVAPMLSSGKASGGQVVQTDEGLKETVSAANLSSSVCKVDFENISMPSNGIDSSETTKGLLSQHVRERVFKYTFQRKRKRGALTGSEVNVPHQKENKSGDFKNDQHMEPSKSSFLVESSRDSRRLAQVARQGTVCCSLPSVTCQNTRKQNDVVKSFSIFCLLMI